jgi:hypothetical protein
MLLATLLACDGGGGCPASDDPTVTIGQGFNAYEPLASGDPVELVYGPQGGVHLTLALEATGFQARRDLTASFTGTIDDEVVATSEPFVVLRCDNTTGTQKVWDLRLIYDADPVTLDDQVTEVSVVLSDDNGREATSTTTITIDDPSM